MVILLKVFPQLFAPARGPATHSKYRNVYSIVKRNARASRRSVHQSVNLQFARLIMHHQEHAMEMLRSASADDEDAENRLTQCINQ